MKLHALFGALLVSASPAIADDYLYLRCKTSVDLVNTNSITSKITEDRIIDDIAILKVDFKMKTIGKPPGSLEPSSITHDLVIIDVLTYITNRQKGIIKMIKPI